MSKMKLMLACWAAGMLAVAAPMAGGPHGANLTVLVAQTQSSGSPTGGVSTALSGYMVAVG
jgi:hypothetical protein